MIIFNRIPLMKTNKLLIFALIGFFSVLKMSAQQDPNYTQYMYNVNIVNPAYAGSLGTLSIGLLGRTQWTEISDNPKTVTFGAHAPVGRRVGMGLSFIADEIGPMKEQNIYADISYTLTTSEEGRLAFGLKGGVTLQKSDFSLIILPQDPDDPLFDENIDNTYPNFGAGVFYYTDKFYVGASVPNILKSKHYNFDSSQNMYTKASEEAHYFLTSGYVFNLSESLKFKPSVMLRGVLNAPLSYDINANFLLFDRFEMGASYRNGSSVSGLFNIGVSREFRIGYAIDLAIGELANLTPGATHEIILLYEISFSKKNIKSPRFF